MDRKAAVALVSLALLTFLLPRLVLGQGQSVYGAITGIVTDPSGAVVPNAKLTATNSATGVQTRVISNSEGYYTVSNLTAGTYSLAVNAAGFQAYKQTDIPVEIDRTIRSTVLQSIPTAYNNATGFVKLLPGVVESPGGNGLPGNDGKDGYFAVNVNGGRSQQNFQQLDGTVDTEPIGGAAGVVPPLDALEAVTATTSNYDVEFGQSQGVVTSLTTKGGTNQWHGSGYEFNQVNATSARNPFTESNRDTAHFVWNQFGGTIGGPIKKNKVFIFGGFQGTRIRSGGNILTTVPTAAFRSGDFSSLAATNPIYDPTTGNPDGSGRTQFDGNIIP